MSRGRQGYRVGGGGTGGGNKLSLSNLHYEVSNEDIKVGQSLILFLAFSSVFVSFSFFLFTGSLWTVLSVLCCPCLAANASAAVVQIST